jgi:hypothetical protein
MVSFVRLITVILVLAGGLAGCERATAIPSGAQQVHVIASETEVHLYPTSVHAGDVYLVLDVPQRGVELVRSGAQAGVSGALTDDDLARVARNADAGGIAIEILTVSRCGNVYKETLASGKYAILLLDAGPSAGSPPASLAVLQVVP